MDTQNITPERAYNKGCMWGMGGGSKEACPYREADLAKKWIDGWDVGNKAYSTRSSVARVADQ